jgi:Cdc6-like AAA superfamily ATPase
MALNFESVGTPLCIIANENKDKKSKNANPIICVAETEKEISKPFQTMSLKEEGQSYQLIPNPSIERQILYVTGSSGSGKSYFTKKYCREFAKIFPKRPIYLISSIDDDTSVDDIKGLKRFKIKGDTFINDTFEIKDFKDSLVIFDDVDCITDKKLRTKVVGILNMILETGRHENVYCIYTSHLATAGNDTKRILNECNSITFFPKTMGTRMMKYLAEGYLGLDKSEIKKLKSIPSRAVTVVKSYPKTIIGDKDVFTLSALDDK